MKKDKYTKSLAKNQVCQIFQMRDIGKNGLPKFIKLCMETPTLGTRGFSRVGREVSVLAEGRHVFGRFSRVGREVSVLAEGRHVFGRRPKPR